MKRTFLAFVILIILCLAGCAHVKNDTQNTPLGIFDGDDGAEEPIQQIAPVYPLKALLLGAEGTVILEATVTETGTMENIKVIETKGYRAEELGQAAIDAVKQWKIDPAMKNGKAVATVIKIPIEFSLVKDKKIALHRLTTSIKSEPQEADIYIDGELITKTNTELYLAKEKTYKFKITKSGYESIERDVVIPQNDSTGLFFSLQKAGN